MSEHWATQYIGTPWLYGGDNLMNGFDCWSFFRYIQKTHFKLDLPIIDLRYYSYSKAIREFSTNDELSNWVKVDKPRNGDAVLLKIAKKPSHIGTYIKDELASGILHIAENIGVVFGSEAQLAKSGWRVCDYYRHRSKL